MSLDSTATALGIKTAMDNFIIGGNAVSATITDYYTAGAVEAMLIKTQLDTLTSTGAEYAVVESKRRELAAVSGISSDGDPNMLASIIDTGFQAAAPSLGNLDISVAAGTLAFIPGQPMHLMIAKACALYWSSAIGPGSPEDVAITGVSNDAAKIETPIANGLLALANTTPPAYTNPPYKDMVDIIYAEVLTVSWTIDEITAAGTGSSYTVTVS